MAEYTYDNQWRLYQMKDSGTVIATYAYDANGNRSSLSYANGVTATYGYNLSNLVPSLENKQGPTVLSQYAYTYLLDGNQSSKTDHTGPVTTYTYDGLGRLTGEQESTGQSLAYGYDSFGNRSSLTATGPESYTTTYQYDRNNRLTTETKAQGGDTLIKDYRYDANGNTVSILPSLLTDPSGGTSSLSLNTDLDGATLNQYDGLNRLVRVETGTTTATYTFRPDGLSNTKTVDGVTTTQVWDGSNLVMELTGDTVTGKYLRGVGLITADLGGIRSYYQYNAHGDVTGLTNTAGALTRSYDYDTFGNEKTAPDANDTNPFRYCGEYLDAETGSYYLRARYYEPGIGRFLSEDSVRDGLNWYTYCGGNPIRCIDPLGLAEVLLQDIVEQYGGLAYWTVDREYCVSFGSVGWKIYGADSIAYSKDNGKIYVDDAAFINEWGIIQSVREVNDEIDVDVVFTQFRNKNASGVWDSLTRQYQNRLTANGNEIDSYYTGDKWITPVSLSGKASSGLDVRKVTYEEADFYNGGFQTDLTNALGDTYKFGYLANLVPTYNAGLSTNDIRIMTGKGATYYFIDGQSKTLKLKNPIGDYFSMFYY